MDTTARKIEALTQLIAHPKTGGEERDAAERMLARLKASVPAAGTRAAWQPKWQGAKYDGNFLPTVEIARLIREDVKLAVKVARAASRPGDLAVYDALAGLPAGVRIGVRMPHYGAIEIRVRNIPADWGYVTETRYRHPEEYPSPALDALGAELRRIGNAYNYDNSDAMTDYYDKRYYLQVTDEHGCSLGTRQPAGGNA